MNVIYVEYLKEKTVFKEICEMTFKELKIAFNSRLVEKTKTHTNSLFQKFLDEEMILIQKEIKLRLCK